MYRILGTCVSLKLDWLYKLLVQTKVVHVNQLVCAGPLPDIQVRQRQLMGDNYCHHAQHWRHWTRGHHHTTLDIYHYYCYHTEHWKYGQCLYYCYHATILQTLVNKMETLEILDFRSECNNIGYVVNKLQNIISRHA